MASLLTKLGSAKDEKERLSVVEEFLNRIKSTEEEMNGDIWPDRSDELEAFDDSTTFAIEYNSLMQELKEIKSFHEGEV